MSRDPSLHASSLNTSGTPSPQDAQVVGGHTPTPWFIETSPLDSWIAAVNSPEDGGDIICDPPTEAGESMRRWKANAAFIVKAVNSHEANEAKIAAAVKALTEIVELTVLKGHTLAAAQIIADTTLSSLKEGK